ncbi:unnamed protein product [Mytilus coruscus]|uniref:Reverse transcriptase domain-containing protein n=1 Tax=Mytilus coruscus TaxID=42192 RepID=A0A6J8DXF9_MYTCO|nr:unnamed protein product [Mytilus coruscus]
MKENDISNGIRNVKVAVDNLKQALLTPPVLGYPGKLKRSCHVEAGDKSKTEKKLPTYSINVAGAPNSTLIKVQNQRHRALVDSSASVSLIHKRIFETFRDKPKLLKKTANLQSVKGGVLHVEGCANLTFKIGITKVTQLFYVVKDMNRNVILGKDWLVQNGVRLYFDLGCLRIQKNYVPLEDIHVASIVRLTVNAVLKPQTINVCPVGLKNNPSFGSTKLLEISPVASGKSRSAWAAPIIIVSNKDKTSRMCVDFRSLNAASKIYFFPLPLIDDLLASVGKAKVMTSLDLKSGCYQVKVKESDKEKTAFVCHKGLFEFNVLPIGLASGPSLFSELVTEVLHGLEHFQLLT